ncbi:MAG: sugar ABC transporter permease [Deltaproteobacteria bacterium]|nr:sugar ABC transporter permease [Deltaproteobacteria bacterium]
MATGGRRAGEAALGGNSRLSLLVDNEKILGFLMIAPAVAYVLALVGYPLVLAFIYSLSDMTVGSTHFNFVGLKNIKYIIQDPEFQTAVKNTLLFTFVSQLIVIVLAKILALLLVKDFKGKFFVRALILMPYVAPISLGVIGWLWMLDSIYSPINWLLQHTGLFGPDFWPMWLGKPDLAMTSIITVHVWRMLPLATVIILAGLCSIPQDIQDAALVDGAGYFRQLFQITIPMMLPIIMVAVLFGIVFTATDIIIILVLTRGGPYDSTQVLVSQAFYTGIDAGDLAQGAAIALFLFPLLLAVAIFMLRIARRAEVA